MAGIRDGWGTRLMINLMTPSTHGKDKKTYR